MRGAAVFVGSIFASALLLFLVEPMVAKMALPRFGGGPAVWSTCLVFFQTLLLAGYAWSHFSVRWLGVRRQLVAQAVLLGVGLLVLPPSLGAGGGAGCSPVWQLLGGLGRAVGLPFLVLASNGSLVQRWFAIDDEREPYFLYAASNAGSLVALVGYPFLVEPLLGLRAQGVVWAAGYGLFAILTGALMWRARRAATKREMAREMATGERPPAAQRGRWLLRSTVGSLLLMAVSTRISTDLAAVPLLWVLPLGIYLGSFVVAFWPRAPRPGRLARTATRLALVVGLGLGPWWTGGPLWWVMAPPLAVLALGCWVCHADLQADRPAPERLTEFYLWISVGGAVGGLLGALAAPLVFSSIAEYPIAFALVALVVAMNDGGAELGRRIRRPGAWVGLLGAGLLLGAGAIGMHQAESAGMQLYCRMLPLLALLSALAVSAWWREQLPGVALLVACATVGGMYNGAQVRAATRGFFGVLRIHESNGVRSLVHGTTVHGSQQIDPPCAEPSSYYHPQAPIGAVLAGEREGARIGVVGLGTGAIAAMVKSSQSLTYYEIDPAVEPMARGWFSYLAESRARVDVVLGDARLTLAEVPRGSFDLMVIDAFSSDAIPVHLITVDALALYLERLAPGGVVLLHISNRYLDLSRLLGAEAKQLSARAAIARFGPSEAQRKAGATPSTVVAIGRDGAAIERLRGQGFAPLAADGRTAVWTDDRSSLLGVLLGR